MAYLKSTMCCTRGFPYDMCVCMVLLVLERFIPNFEILSTSYPSSVCFDHHINPNWEIAMEWLQCLNMPSDNELKHRHELQVMGIIDMDATIRQEYLISTENGDIVNTENVLSKFNVHTMRTSRKHWHIPKHDSSEDNILDDICKSITQLKRNK